MATNVPMPEPRRTYIGDPLPQPWRVGDYPYVPWQPTYPDPIPMPIYPSQPAIYPTIRTTTTTNGDLLGIGKRDRRIKELEALLSRSR